jgi:hypothetical protein
LIYSISCTIGCGDFTSSAFSISSRGAVAIVCLKNTCSGLRSILFINSYDDREKVFSLKLATLALSIKEINDTPFVSFIGLDSDSLEEKVNVLEQLQSNLLDTLFNSYAELSKESSDIVSVQEIKN